MELLPQNVNPSESRFDDPNLAPYYYRHINTSIYSIGIKNLEEAALARDLAELRLMRLLRGYTTKEHSEK
jgi:hypothetical protein